MNIKEYGARNESVVRSARRRKTAVISAIAIMVILLTALAVGVRYGMERAVPEQARERYTAAATAYRAGNIAESIETLNDLVTAWPDFTEARMLLGQALAVSGEPESARTHLRSVVAENPEDRLSILWLVRAEVAVGDEEGVRSAVENLEHVMFADDGDTRLYHALGILYEQQGDVTSAVAAFERAARLLRRDARVHLDLGRVYYRLGLEDRARASLEEAASVTGDGPIAAAANSLIARMLLGRPRGHVPETTDNRWSALEGEAPEGEAP